MFDNCSIQKVYNSGSEQLIVLIPKSQGSFVDDTYWKSDLGGWKRTRPLVVIMILILRVRVFSVEI